MQFIKRLKPMTPAQQNPNANTIYVDTDDETIKVGTGASGSTERQLLTTGSETNSLTLRVSALGVGIAAGAAGTIISSGSITGVGFVTSATSIYAFTSRGALRANADGVFQLEDTAGTSFGRLQFGGSTSSYPSIKRNTTELDFRLADDSGYVNINANNVTFNNAAIQSGSAAQSGAVRLANNNTVAWRNQGGSADGTLTYNSNDKFAFSTVAIACAAIALPAGGSTSCHLDISSTSNFGIYVGSGAPTVSAPKGSLYLRSDGSGTTDRMYVNTNGSTTWTAVTTVA
jgi:hypothetical protein